MRPPWRVLSDGALPTEEIYFLASAAPTLRAEGAVIERQLARRRRLALWRVGPRARRHLAGARVVLCRGLAPDWLRWLERHRGALASVHYLIDDDLSAAAADRSLPAAYRARMARLARQQPRLLALADEVVAASRGLANQLADRHPRVALLTPPLLAPLPLLAHFDIPPTIESPWWVGFHGTRAHLADLRHIAPALVRLHEARTDVAFEVMLGAHVPDELSRLWRCDTPSPLPWPRFRDYQRQRRMHIGLAPLLDTPFNRGKSFIKFLDIAAMGGVGIYSRRPPYTEIVEDGVNGLLADDTPEAWCRCLTWLLDHPVQAARMARAAADTARRVGDIRHVVAFWRDRDGGAPAGS
ncbi:glycosyltransferase [Halomonas sp. JS92-SW72]|uniref:glycosyltransferase family protein n=1 Tax=Halomonas sp. JS92-SW72 TaxID=2306583 RepID=UPI000E5A665D|nr:glycosyltransferase [Halomonas sp. JS92-SW72]AXY41431.1 glycosyltransferase family 1 protein [Halomonas sp. JS92-SW72]